MKNNRLVRVLRFLRIGLPFGLVALLMVVSFQNCDGGFHYNSGTGELSSLNAGVGSDAFKITTFHPGGAGVAEGQTLEGGVEYRLEASGSSLKGATLMWALPTNTGNCLLKTGTAPHLRFVQCDRAGRVTIQATAILEDGSTSVLTSERTTSALIVDLCGTSTSMRIVFRIPPGTGTSAWNSPASPLVVAVGQTIRVCNSDTVNHQLTTGGAGCANQAAPMAPGAVFDCIIANRNNVDPGTGNYNGWFDTIGGNSAAFYVRPFDGQALYADGTQSSNNQSCASCHGGFAQSTKRGASFTAIKNAIGINRGGMGIFAAGLSDDEIRAISVALNR